MSKTLTDWLKDLESRYPQEIHLGLERVQKVACLLGLENQSALVITVAGTNGKGSTVATLEAIYQKAGYQTGSYTSPHLIHFSERIKINQIPCKDETICHALERIEQAGKGIALTYFEFVTLAALYIFKQQPLDLLILEVGLGGRLDAVNLVDADLAIITGIDFDHQDYLGNTLEAIGHEKAGIMRPQKPCIYADYTPPPQSIIANVIEKEAFLIQAGRDYQYEFKTRHLYYQNHCLPLPYSRLHPNAVTAAVIAVKRLEKNLPLSHEAIVEGILTTDIQGRQQCYVENGKTILLDVAHNAQSVRYLASYIELHFPNRKVHAVFSALKDKDLPALLNPMKTVVACWYPAKLEGKRALSLTALAQIFEANEITIDLCYNDPFLAYQSACNQANSDDLIVVYGSFLTVAAVLERSNYEINNR